VTRTDPFHGFRFRVEVDQVQHGGFSRVKNLARETKVDTYREGGVNDHELQLASLTTYPHLVLERGLVDPYLWSWHDDVVDGRIERRTITIALHDVDDGEVWRWILDGAFPVKWSGADLDANGSQVLVESVELAHHGLRRG
jgi:phage tail-like protein